jgi:uncharacterized protein (TIGR02594 family)
MSNNTVPPWLVDAASYIGFHEIGNNRGIEHFISLAHAGALGDPWCAIFANACLEEVGIRGTRSAAARSFEHDANFVRLAGPALGAIVTRWRSSPWSGLGHVFFYLGENDNGIVALAGNERDQVCRYYEQRAPITGYWWPKSVALPAVGPLVVDEATALTGALWAADLDVPKVPDGSVGPAPISSTALATRFMGITMSVFGGSGDRQTSAYDDHVISNTELGCALPYHFPAPVPKVRIYANGKSVVVPIVDVGPWNDNPPDAYWLTGARPQAESGHDLKGRKTNHAGIDGTPGTWRALGLDPEDGLAIVQWEFVTQSTEQPPMVDSSSAPTAPATTDSSIPAAPAFDPAKIGQELVNLSERLADASRRFARIGAVLAKLPAAPLSVPSAPAEQDQSSTAGFGTGILSLLAYVGALAGGFVGTPTTAEGGTAVGMLWPAASAALAALGATGKIGRAWQMISGAWGLISAASAARAKAGTTTTAALTLFLFLIAWPTGSLAQTEMPHCHKAPPTGPCWCYNLHEKGCERALEAEKERTRVQASREGISYEEAYRDRNGIGTCTHYGYAYSFKPGDQGGQLYGPPADKECPKTPSCMTSPRKSEQMTHSEPAWGFHPDWPDGLGSGPVNMYYGPGQTHDNTSSTEPNLAVCLWGAEFHNKHNEMQDRCWPYWNGRRNAVAAKKFHCGGGRSELPLEMRDKLLDKKKASIKR